MIRLFITYKNGSQKTVDIDVETNLLTFRASMNHPSVRSCEILRVTS